MNTRNAVFFIACLKKTNIKLNKFNFTGKNYMTIVQVYAKALG